MDKPSGLCRDQHWADKDNKKAHLGTRWKANPFGGDSHAKGIVLKKVGIEAKQRNSAIYVTEQLVRKKSEHNECLISTLEELSLHQEDIERVEHVQNWCRELKILLLQSNLISKIENLHKLKKLEYLNLALNNVTVIENLEGLESLQKLDLTLNFIGDLTSIESLRYNYNLRELLLIGNPCCDYPHYKQFVIATLPQLTSLDCIEILVSERMFAEHHRLDYRAVIVQQQVKYFIERDEQKIRVRQQQEDLANRMEAIEDEDERTKLFWQAKSEHCPESRNEIAKFHKLCRERNAEAGNNKSAISKNHRSTPIFFAPCGRPYNLNQAKLPFNFCDEPTDYILQLEVYRYMETNLIDVEIEPNYVRVKLKGKYFQIAFNEEVKTSESIVQRAQITGHMLIKMPKLNPKEVLKPASPADCKLETKQNQNQNQHQHQHHQQQQQQSQEFQHQVHHDDNGLGNRATGVGKFDELKGSVDIKNICVPTDLPDLI